ncbi:SWIM zinc finger family protein [Siphonobacter sp. BAB-5385]|uniref:SWIM zinc finger family protein n=1 Tax=Siphonobacter sp. BAB-5385 TaxID=1864822 RepID=UPI0011407C42|nr:SWIM zinc finger family protein [Siphonobacter sp. BAB-5385]
MSTYTYHYANASALKIHSASPFLSLAAFNEDSLEEDIPCYFWGSLLDPYVTARAFMTLSKVVRSRFTLSAAERSAMRDPIVTAGAGLMRLEAFSGCNGVYARVDMLPSSLDGEFLGSGTTNVDFNEPMIQALSTVSRQDKLLFSVGEKEVILEKQGQQIIERKVTLPTRWIKGLTAVQAYLSTMEPFGSYSKVQTLQLFQSLPRGETSNDFFLTYRANRPVFSPVASGKSLRIGGLHRLRLLEALVPLQEGLDVFQSPDEQATAFVFKLGTLRFLLTLSRETKRGFSGEGNILDTLMEAVPESYIQGARQLFQTNEAFNPTLLSLEKDLDPVVLNRVSMHLSAMGLLGYDVIDHQFFYRKLPFRPSRILSLNPRLKNAQSLLEADGIEILEQTSDRVQARVRGSKDNFYRVLIEGNKARCTCPWYASHEGLRGSCKHVLAVQLALQS